MDKASRLVFGDSLMTHAMVLTGCHVEGSSVTRFVTSPLHDVLYHRNHTLILQYTLTLQNHTSLMNFGLGGPLIVLIDFLVIELLFQMES